MVRNYPSQQSTNSNATGSIILNFTENSKTIGFDNVKVSVNGILKKIQYSDVDGLYTIKINQNDVVYVLLSVAVSQFLQVNITRNDYTTDDEGNLGIVENSIYNNYTTGGTSLDYTFTTTTSLSSYHFDYVVNFEAITSTYDVYKRCSDNTNWIISYNPIHETLGLINGLYCGIKLASNATSDTITNYYTPFYPMSTFVNDPTCTPCIGPYFLLDQSGNILTTESNNNIEIEY